MTAIEDRLGDVGREESDIHFGLLVVLAMVTTSCGPDIKLLKRYQTLDDSQVRIGDPQVTVSFFTMEPPKPKSASLVAQLSERGQAALIEAAAAGNSKPVLAVLKGDGAKLKTDRASITRRVVISLDPRAFGPADRISEARITFAIDKSTSGIEFVRWNRFENEYAELDLGSATFTQSNKQNFSVAAELPDVGPAQLLKPSASFEFAQSLVEQLKAQLKLVTFRGIFSPTSATIVQAGAASIDLSGTSTMDFVMRATDADIDDWTVLTFDNLFDKTRKPIAPGEVTVTATKVEVPRATCNPVVAQVNYEIFVRTVPVNSGAASPFDYDDDVTLRKLAGTAAVKLLEPSDLDPGLFVLSVPGNELPVSFRDPYSTDPTKLSLDAMIFPSKETAAEFLAWLRIRASSNLSAGSVAGIRLAADGLGKPLTANHVKQLWVLPLPETQCKK